MRPAGLVVAATALGLVACAGILGLRTDGRRPFAHRAHVVQGIACVDCHRGIASAGDTDAVHLPGTATCISCHTSPHDTRECIGCHGSPMAEASIAEAKKHLVFSHQQHLEMAKGNCARCHVGVREDEHELRPTMSVCLGCHQHRDQFKVRECDGCHVDLAEEGTRPASHLVHDGNFLREHGVVAAGAGELCQSCHKESFCASCHGASVPALPSRLTFDAPNRAGMHRAGFAARHVQEAHAQPGLCTTCHTESSCQRCHQDRGVAATDLGGQVRNPHPPGWVGVGASQNEHGRAARRDPASCASCHGGAGEALCVSCHVVGGIGGNPHPPGWRSRRPLDAMPCRLCHVR